MSKVKLNLRPKTFEQLGAFAASHRDALVDNPHFLMPEPTPAVFDTTLENYLAKMDEIAALEVQLAVVRAERDSLRKEVEENLVGRGKYVENAASGARAPILSAAFEVQAQRTATTSMEKPHSVVMAMAANPGAVTLRCRAVTKAKSYIIEMREHSDTGIPGPWTLVQASGRSWTTISGLVSGKRYAFRLRALGPNLLQSPWSDAVSGMAP